jgi:hypothetical protein
MSAQIVDQDEGETPTDSRPSDGSADLGAKDIRSAPRSQATIKPAVTPIDEAEAIDFIVGPGRCDKALPASTFATPDAGEGRMERELDLILQRESSPRQEVKQGLHIWWHFSEQGRLDEGSHGWRGGRASPGQGYLHPQAFPT